MDMRFFWVGDKVAQEMYKLRWHPGQENLADYRSKHHAMSHHNNVHPLYLYMENSPRFLPRAQKPSALKRCVGTLNDGYIRNVPLPRAPRIQSASHLTCHGAVKRDGSTPLHSTQRINSTPLHSTRIRAAPRIQSASHVTCYGAVTREGFTPLHSTPLHSTPLHFNPLAYKPAVPQIQSIGHVTCYGAITRDGYTPLHSTPLAYKLTYVHSTPLVYVPAAPRIQSRGHVTSHEPVTRDDVPEPDTCYLQVPLLPTWSDLIRSLTGLGRCPRIIPFFTCMVTVDQ